MFDPGLTDTRKSAPRGVKRGAGTVHAPAPRLLYELGQTREVHLGLMRCARRTFTRDCCG